MSSFRDNKACQIEMAASFFLKYEVRRWCVALPLSNHGEAMTAVNDFIFGNGNLHERFCAITELLEKLVRVAPSPLSLAQMKRHTGRSSRDINKHCLELVRNGLVIETSDGHWTLAGDAADLTLEDVYRCAMARQEWRSPVRRADHQPNHVVDLLLMQAVLAINQSVHQHLRQFSLDRLKPASNVPFPLGRNRLHGLNYNGNPDIASAAHSA
jgi:DNA-binding IscR family transcriptional regulator